MLISLAASIVLDMLCKYNTHVCYRAAVDVPISHLLHLLKGIRWGNNGHRECWKRQEGYLLLDHAHIGRACAALYQDCLGQSCMRVEPGLAHNCSETAILLC